MIGWKILNPHVRNGIDNGIRIIVIRMESQNWVNRGKFMEVCNSLALGLLAMCFEIVFGFHWFNAASDE